MAYLFNQRNVLHRTRLEICHPDLKGRVLQSLTFIGRKSTILVSILERPHLNKQAEIELLRRQLACIRVLVNGLGDRYRLEHDDKTEAIAGSSINASIFHEEEVLLLSAVITQSLERRHSTNASSIIQLCQ